MDLRCDCGCSDVRMGEMSDKAELGFEARDTLHVVRVVTSDGFKRSMVVKLINGGSRDRGVS